MDDIVPWWERNIVDHDCGGFYSCLERDGRPYASDKFMWMNARAVWTFSHLYNTLEPCEQWRSMADRGVQFMLNYAYRDDGKMYFRLTRAGKPLATALSIFTESFATIALAELSAATGKRDYWNRAVQMYDRLMPRFGLPSDTPLLGYPLNCEFHLQSHDMVALSICAVIWVITAEIFPNRIRGRAVSIATFSNWAANTISVFLFPWFVARFGVDAGFYLCRNLFRRHGLLLVPGARNQGKKPRRN